MGDRSVVGFRADDSKAIIYLYSHWGGESQSADLAEAIAKAQPRWDDPEYATRIAISQIVGDRWDSETGYGLSVHDYTAPDYDFVLVVNWGRRTVERHGAVPDGGRPRHDTEVGFVDFIANPPAVE